MIDELDPVLAVELDEEDRGMVGHQFQLGLAALKGRFGEPLLHLQFLHPAFAFLQLLTDQAEEVVGARPDPFVSKSLLRCAAPPRLQALGDKLSSKAAFIAANARVFRKRSAKTAIFSTS